MINFLAYFSDPQGLPRAFGKSTSKEDATAIAQIELDAYRDEKRVVGDPLADAKFTLTIKEVL
jgi:hypothetical protein